MNEAGGPAFPMHPVCMKGEEGMTLRDYFAAKAMQSLIVETGRALQHCEGVEFIGLNIVNNEGGTPLAIAEESYLMADAMLKARHAG